MKKFLTPIVVLCIVIFGCTSQKTVATSDKKVASVNDTVRIANDSLEYEIIIIDPGFNTWFLTNAKPRNFYTKEYLRGRNIPWVLEWNNRARNPGRYSNLFEMQIDYQTNIDYGYEVNYMLYNYLTYFQIANNIRLGGFVPRN